MKLFIDSADVKEIARLLEIHNIAGVTTNPTILTRGVKDPSEGLKTIRKLIGDERILFAQAVRKDCEGIVAEGRHMVEVLGKNTVVKIPCITEGYKAMKQLKKEGITTLGTVVYTPSQALFAANAGASYVAPYLNRIECMGFDALETIRRIQNLLENGGYECEVLGASFKNAHQVLDLAEYGIASATLAPEIFDLMAKNEIVDGVVDRFVNDFEKAYGKGRTMLDL